MDKLQVNVRLSPELLDGVDRKRIELQPVLGKIPTRSDVVRYALEKFLTADNEKAASSTRGETPKA